MNLFFLSLAIIFCGGILSLVFRRQFILMKTIGVMAISGGCLLGLIDAGTKLLRPGPYGAAFEYLNAFSLAFQIDALAAFFLVAIYAVCLLAALYSYHYMDNSRKALRTAGNYFFFSLLAVFMALVVTAGNLITFMLSWEIMSLSSFFLVIYNYESGENRKAGYLYFVFSQVGAMFILAAFGLIYAHSGNFGFADAAALPETAKIIVFVLAFIGLGSKAGVFPFHVWLPHAHPAASSHISAVMSGVMIKTGVYGIIRIYMILDWHASFFGYFVLIAGIISGILGIVYALGQRDLKRLLAYSSVENIGIILIGLGIGMIGVATGKPVMAVLGFAGSLLHVLNHSIYKSLLFMGAGMLLHKTGTRSIDQLGGLIKKMKITGTTFLIGSIAICGLPPLNGFVSEFLVYLGGFRGMALEKTSFAMCLLAIVSLAIIGGLALACFTKVVGVVFQGEPRNQVAENTDENGVTMLIPMLILAAACMVIGVFPTFFMTLALKAVGSLGLGYGRLPLEPFIELTANISRTALLVFVVFLLILALRTLLYRGKTLTRSGTWGCGFTRPTVKMQYTGSSYAASILEFFRPVAPLTENDPGIRTRFPAKSHYHSHISDIAELHMGTVVVRPVLALFEIVVLLFFV
jgi:hydrogenase-4 component B